MVSCRVVSARKLLLRTHLKIVEIVIQNLHFAFSSLKGIGVWGLSCGCGARHWLTTGAV